MLKVLIANSYQDVANKTNHTHTIKPIKIMSKLYTCTATIQVTVQADNEFDAPHEAGMHLDIGDIEWDVEEVSSEK